MEPEDIDPHGWTALRVTDTRMDLMDDGTTTVTAKNTMPLRNLIPLITSNERPWEIRFKDVEGNIQETREYPNREEALQALQTHLEENPAE